jgi:formylglycine-generating enzyme required for sulfatase activity
MRFCIDRYEWPNVAGEKPAVMQSYLDAERECAARSKRVCTSDEWTLACEGPERLPYPYGLTRDAAACNVDRPWIAPHDVLLESPRAADRDAELARLDGRDPSGSHARCVSAFGVFDLTGNVDEWTRGAGGRATLKGGAWGPYRNACRPATAEHAAGFRYYQTGFRCCSDGGP